MPNSLLELSTMLQALNVTWTVPDRSYTAGGRLFVDRQIKSKSEMPILSEAKSDILHFDSILTRPK